MKNIALLGFGTVGSGVAELIENNDGLIMNNLGERVNIKYILDIRDFKGHRYESKFTKDFNVILDDKSVDIVVEMIGGSHPAYDFTLAALKSGKSVVTSNKEVVAEFGPELLRVAEENKVSYLFEASVGGGIPIIRPMMNSLVNDRILSIYGILNGTTNYILTQMFEKGVSFEDALKSAQNFGYAEANPAADIEGVDVCRKICILAAIAGGLHISTDRIYTDGIKAISKEDIDDAAKIGASVKLIGYYEKCEDAAMISVEPRMVMSTNPLSTIKDVFNGVFLNTSGAGQLMFFGRGAGKLPTASAVLSDISEIIKNDYNSIVHERWEPAEANSLKDIMLESKDRYVRVRGEKTPNGAEVISKTNSTVSFILKDLNGYELVKILYGYDVISAYKIIY